MGFFDDVVKTVSAVNPAAAFSNLAAGSTMSALSGLGRTEGLDGARGDMALATKEANEYLKQAYDKQMGMAEPWQNAGLAALAGLNNYNPANDPGYQFRLNQGLGGINSALAARGMGNSGAALKALTRFNQDFASNEYGNGWNRLYNIAGLGQNAFQNAGNWAGQYGRGVAENKMAQGGANVGYNIARGNQGKELLGQGLKFGTSLLGLAGF